MTLLRSPVRLLFDLLRAPRRRLAFVHGSHGASLLCGMLHRTCCILDTLTCSSPSCSPWLCSSLGCFHLCCPHGPTLPALVISRPRVQGGGNRDQGDRAPRSSLVSRRSKNDAMDLSRGAHHRAMAAHADETCRTDVGSAACAETMRPSVSQNERLRGLWVIRQGSCWIPGSWMC